MEIVKSLRFQQINTSNVLSFEISRAQIEMNNLAEKYGISHELTVAKSQEIDEMMNEYMIQGHRESQNIIAS